MSSLVEEMSRWDIPWAYMELIALVGVNILFYVDTLTFIIGCLLFLGLNVSNENIKREINHPKERVYFRELKDGFQYVLGFPLSPFILGIVVSGEAHRY